MLENTVEEVIRVKTDASPHEIAAAATAVVMQGRRPKLRTIGAGALNQAVKGAIIARSNLALRGIDIVIRPGFADVEGRDGVVSGIVLELLRTDALS